MSVEEFITVTDEILTYLHQENVQGIPIATLDRLLDYGLMTEIRIFVATIPQKANEFFKRVSKCISDDRSEDVSCPFSDQDVMVLQRIYLFCLFGGSIGAERRTAAPSTYSSSQTQGEFPDLPSRRGRYEIATSNAINKKISKQFRRFYYTVAEILGTFLKSSAKLIIKEDEDLVKNYSQVFKQEFQKTLSLILMDVPVNDEILPEFKMSIMNEADVTLITHLLNFKITRIIKVTSLMIQIIHKLSNIPEMRAYEHTKHSEVILLARSAVIYDQTLLHPSEDLILSLVGPVAVRKLRILLVYLS
jgi:hypothetical protein